jgi:hypothetical protein
MTALLYLIMVGTAMLQPHPEDALWWTAPPEPPLSTACYMYGGGKLVCPHPPRLELYYAGIFYESSGQGWCIRVYDSGGTSHVP